MASKRVDHFGGPSAEAERPEALLAKGTPPVSPLLVEYLERQFKPPAPRPGFSVDDMIANNWRLAEHQGAVTVINHLRAIANGDQS